MTPSRNLRKPNTTRPLQTAWIPSALFLLVALGLTIPSQFEAMLTSFKLAVTISHFDDPEEARFWLSSGLRPYFDRADSIKPLLRDGEYLLVSGLDRLFIPYRLAPRPCFLDRAAVITSLRKAGIDWVHLSELEKVLVSGQPRIDESSLLLRANFEQGSTDEWTRAPTIDPRGTDQ